ncbi:MAG: hypothetical protein IJD83_03780 [Clostridia bacterium]|nr:hypothetical protein [Clostridia bacterium]
MDTKTTLQELNAIAATLNQKLSEVRACGDFQAADKLEDTLKRLKHYIAEKEKSADAQTRT